MGFWDFDIKTYDILVVLIIFVLVLFTGFCYWLLAKLCTRSIVYGVVLFKILPYGILTLSLVVLILYNCISYAAGYKISIRIEIAIIFYIVLGIIIILSSVFGTKIIPLCCGRRNLRFNKQTRKTLTEVLTDINKNIPSHEEVLLIEERARKYLYNNFHEELVKEFSGNPIDMLFTNLDPRAIYLFYFLMSVKPTRKKYRGKRHLERVWLFTGSGAERFGLPISSEWYSAKSEFYVEYPLLTDFDFMFYLQNFSASHFHIISNDLDEKIQPGFAKLMLTDLGSSILCIPNDTFLCTNLIKKRIYAALSKTKRSDYPGGEFSNAILKPLKAIPIGLKKKGPAVKIKVGKIHGFFLFSSWNNHMFLADLTFSIETEWPSSVDWSTRGDRVWPTINHMKRIASYGCHLVPKSQSNDQKAETWRFSFSKAEVELSKLINPIARNCFLALKVISKDHLQPIAKWFTSYHIKTIFFHTLEITPLDMWAEENFIKCFDLLMKELMTSLSKGSCKHFWISSINLFDIDGISSRHFSRLLSKVELIRQNPEWYIDTWDDYDWEESYRKLLWNTLAESELDKTNSNNCSKENDRIVLTSYKEIENWHFYDWEESSRQFLWNTLAKRDKLAERELNNNCSKKNDTIVLTSYKKINIL